MSENAPRIAVVMPVGPGKESALDTLESLEVFCPEPHVVIIYDDHTGDGTYEALCAARRPNWQIVRNERPHRIERLVHTLGYAYERVLSATDCDLVLRLDQDALIIKPGLFGEALAYQARNPEVGLFGVYEIDYNRPRHFDSHRRLFDQEAAWYRRWLGKRPSWMELLRLAEQKGYRRGENVFGGAYFITRPCLQAAQKIGALTPPWRWNSRMQEDVYFSMATVAAGFKMGHFAAPDGPLCMEWRGLPYPAAKLAASHYKLIHSVDKGPNTGTVENGGKTARGVFRELRTEWSHRMAAGGGSE